MTFKSTSELSQNGPSLVQSNIAMKLGTQTKNTVSQTMSINHTDEQDYNTPPSPIGNATRIFKPNAVDEGGMLFTANHTSHKDELIPGTMLPVSKLNDWYNFTHDEEYEPAASVIIMTTTTSPSNTSFTCTKTRDPRLHDDQY
jgi:hypothetical protein